MDRSDIETRRALHFTGALDAAMAHTKKGVLVFRLDAFTLRDLHLTPLRVASVLVVQP